MRLRHHAPRASEWLAVVGVLLLVAVGAAAAATGGFRRSTTRRVTVVRTPAPVPQPLGRLAIEDVTVSTSRSTFSAVIRWRTSVPATSYLAFRLGSLGLAASTPLREGVRHAGVLRDMKRNTVYHLWIVASRGARTIRRAAVVSLPH